MATVATWRASTDENTAVSSASRPSQESPETVGAAVETSTPHEAAWGLPALSVKPSATGASEPTGGRRTEVMVAPSWRAPLGRFAVSSVRLRRGDGGEQIKKTEARSWAAQRLMMFLMSRWRCGCQGDPSRGCSS